MYSMNTGIYKYMRCTARIQVMNLKQMKPTYSDVQHKYKYIQIASLGSSPKHTWMSNPHQQKVSQHPLLHVF